MRYGCESLGVRVLLAGVRVWGRRLRIRVTLSAQQRRGPT